MGQTTGSENGIYVSAIGAWARSTDFDGTGGNVSASAFTFVEQGTKYGDTGWTLSTDGVIVGTTPLAFTQFSSAGVFQAGNGRGPEAHIQGWDLALQGPSADRAVLGGHRPHVLARRLGL